MCRKALKVLVDAAIDIAIYAGASFGIAYLLSLGWFHTVAVAVLSGAHK